MRQGPFYWHGSNLKPARIYNHMTSKMWDSVTYPFPKFNKHRRSPKSLPHFQPSLYCTWHKDWALNHIYERYHNYNLPIYMGEPTPGPLFARFRELSKPRDSGLNFSNRSEIWQVHRQRCCRGACQISERYDLCIIQSRGFETSRDLAVRRLTT